MKKVNLIKMLVAIGVAQATAEKIAANTPDDGTEVIDDAGATTIVADLKKIQIDLAKNDPSIVTPIQEAEKAKQLDIVERKIKQVFDLDPEKIKGKKFEEIVTLAKEKASEGKDKTVTTLEEENMALKGEVKKLKEEEIPKIRQEVDSHKDQIDWDQYLTKEVTANELRNPLTAVLPTVKNFLNDNYDIRKDDKGNRVLYQKGTDLRAKTEDGNAFLNITDVVKTRLTVDGFLKESNADDDDGKGGKKKDPIKVKKDGEKKDSEPKNMLHLGAAEQHAAMLAEAGKKK